MGLRIMNNDSLGSPFGIQANDSSTIFRLWNLTSKYKVYWKHTRWGPRCLISKQTICLPQFGLNQTGDTKRKPKNNTEAPKSEQ